MAQQQHPGDYQPDSPEQLRYPSGVRILQKRTFLDDWLKMAQVLSPARVTDICLRVKLNWLGAVTVAGISLSLNRLAGFAAPGSSNMGKTERRKTRGPADHPSGLCVKI